MRVALVLVLLAACSKDEPKVVAAGAVSLVNAALPASAPTVVDETLPGWVKEGARFETRDGKRVAVATAVVKSANPALARDAAANRARAAILRLIQKKGPSEPVEGTLEGSRVVKAETIGGSTAVEVEADAP